MSFFVVVVFACLAVRDLCRSGCRQNYCLNNVPEEITNVTVLVFSS